jgi:hypothetical protein
MSQLVSVQISSVGADIRRSMPTAEQLREAMRAGGQRVVDDLVDWYHLTDASEPNRFVQEGTGTRRTHFWNQIADSIRGPIVGGDSVEIRITDKRINQKIYGGVIAAKNVRFLTIPIHPEAYARRAAELESIAGKLFVIRMKDGRLFLCGKDDSKKAVFYYRLKESVNQKPWPTAIPRQRKWFVDSFRNGMRRFLRSLRN